MKWLLIVASVVGVSVCLPSASGPIVPTLRLHAKRQAQAPTFKLADLIQQFGLDLSGQQWDEPGNVAFSPLSISSLLSLLMVGSERGTYNQLRRTLGYPTNAVDININNEFKKLTQTLVKSDEVIVNIATRLFPSNSANVLADFTKQAEDYYNATVHQLNFFNDPIGSMNSVNDWIKTETRGKIPRLLTQPFGARTIFVAANTVYFNGAWENSFIEEHTQHDGTFRTGPASNITIPMMRTTMTVPFINIPELKAEMIAFPYLGWEFAMYVILPKGPIEDQALRNIERGLDADKINKYIGDMRNSTRNVALPRMKLQYKTYLKKTLRALGVTDMFDTQKARFTRLTGYDRIYVDDMVHQTVVEITETGTVAASATSISLNRIGTSNSFIVDRPAIFFIRHMKSGLPLFWGRILEPVPLPLASNVEK